MKRRKGIHEWLLKWDSHYRRPAFLCEVQFRLTWPRTTLRLPRPLDRIARRRIKTLFALDASCQHTHDASNYTYACATRGQTTADWIGGMVCAMEYAGGVPELPYG
ncbi:hypothetical protein E0W60_34850 (plasmid) [Cupriavidus oxalaticus]|uniref:Transposase n=1 Tax=Cupriavidus oxalaticus TaxID=96344 RepID=A0A4P7LUS4_9BURK|nr:hypothetical protein E0W60_34850 [Cupriavidus oxalaticus]